MVHSKLGTKPLPEAMLADCQLDPLEENFIEIWSKINQFSMDLKMSVCKMAAQCANNEGGKLSAGS